MDVAVQGARKTPTIFPSDKKNSPRAFVLFKSCFLKFLSKSLVM